MKNECKNCQHFNLANATCILDGKKKYINYACIEEDCKDYRDGEWGFDEDFFEQVNKEVEDEKENRCFFF